eukprot:364752-Chlamydomonas_euryale.AAC.3
MYGLIAIACPTLGRSRSVGPTPRHIPARAGTYKHRVPSESSIEMLAKTSALRGASSSASARGGRAVARVGTAERSNAQSAQPASRPKRPLRAAERDPETWGTFLSYVAICPRGNHASARVRSSATRCGAPPWAPCLAYACMTPTPRCPPCMPARNDAHRARAHPPPPHAARRPGGHAGGEAAGGSRVTHEVSGAAGRLPVFPHSRARRRGDGTSFRDCLHDTRRLLVPQRLSRSLALSPHLGRPACVVPRRHRRHLSLSHERGRDRGRERWWGGSTRRAYDAVACGTALALHGEHKGGKEGQGPELALVSWLGAWGLGASRHASWMGAGRLL